MSPLGMSLLLIVGWGAFAYSSRRRWRLMMVGGPAPRFDHIGERIRLTLRYALAQMRMRRYPVAGAAHMLIFSGFVILLLRSLILWGRGFDEEFSFWIFSPDQPFGALYALLKDLFAVLVIIGALVFFYFRLIVRPARLTYNLDGLIILGIILVMMVADILYDGASMAARGRGFTAWEPAGSMMAMLVGGMSDGSLEVLRHIGFWTHSALVLIFLNILPYSKHFHVITAFPNVFMQDLTPRGRLVPIDDLEGSVEREETLGVRRLDQFSRKAMLDFYTCTECGRCSDVCPATITGKKLSPKHFIVDLRDFLYKHETALVAGSNGGATHAEGGDDEPSHRIDLVDGVIDPEVLWACTTCRACEEECPVFISFVDKIVDMRRYLVQERGEFPAELQTAFRGMESSMNPWGFPADERAKWSVGLDVPLLADKPDAEVLLWVGCAPSFDDRAKKVSQALVSLFKQAGVNFAILGTEEKCTGDPARRAGNEYLFQFFARANVETLNGYQADKKTIVTSCPHCFNTLANEYGDFGGKYRVVHHTEFLAGLLRDGKLKPTKSVDARVTYHDSCYLGRYNDIYDAPRKLLESIPGLTLVEPAETRDRGMCCGAGGAQMFKEEEPGTDRVNAVRTDQLLATGAETVASACPFCMRMLTDGIAGKHREEVKQLDVAELLLQSVGEEATKPDAAVAPA